VVGVERDPALAAAARAYAGEAGLANVEVVEGDALAVGLPAGGFDLVHARFVLPHVPDPAAFLAGMRALARPGGAVAVQEPDHHSWHFYPPCPAWPRLLAVLEAAFALRGDINIGRRAFGLLRGLGLTGVTARAALLALQDGHPYMRMPLVALDALRAPILAAGLADAAELETLAGEVARHAAQPDTLQLTFTVVQVWGRRPGPGGGLG
jgi:SAM-dependent methyltransferase